MTAPTHDAFDANALRERAPAGRARRHARRSRSLAAAAAACAILAGAGAARAEAQAGPRATIEAANRQIQTLLAEAAPDGTPAATRRDEALRRAVGALLDIDAMAEEALGRQWRETSDADRRTYLDLMRQLVERSYLRQARDRTQYAVEVGAVDEDGDRAEVATTVRVETRGRTETIEVVYALARRDGRWRVVDVETDGASTVRNYRAQFRRIVREQGLPALLDRMRERLAAGETDL